MKDLPWFTIATFIVAFSNALAGMAGELDPDTAAMLMTASVVLGGFGKAIYSLKN